MSTSSDVASATLLSMTNSVMVFTTLLPAFPDVRKASPMDHDMLNDVRMGELAASALVIGVGVVASKLTGSHAPTIVAAVTSAALVFMYESALSSTGAPTGIVGPDEVERVY